MGFKEKYARRKLRKLTEKVTHKPVLPDIEKVQTIGVIWQPTEKEAFTFIKNFFNRDKIIFRGFCVYEESVNPPEYSNTITVNDLNWWGLPKPEKTEEFIGMNFDLLMNIALKQNLVLDYITALSQAKFKVGWSPDENNFFDLNINIGEKEDAMYLAKQQIFYLAQLNKKNSK